MMTPRGQSAHGKHQKATWTGLTDYWLYGVLQKSLTKPAVGRLNGGILFTGINSTGLIGIEAVRGQVFTGNGSLMRDFSDKLKLGIEVFGGVTGDFNLSRGQLEAQIGGSYAVRDDFAFTFGACRSLSSQLSSGYSCRVRLCLRVTYPL